MNTPLSGQLEKMQVQPDTPISYALRVGDAALALNPLLGKTLELAYNGEIRCLNCDRLTRKSYNQGYCFPCSQRLARCDICVLKPERCHYHQGTCREPDWGLTHCMQPHIVYLANSSGLKVGITRESQIPTRWIDQGAVQGLPLFRTQNRHQAGLLEVALATKVADKTNWRAMLRGDPSPVDLAVQRDMLLQYCADKIAALADRFPDGMVPISAAQPRDLAYPVLEYPSKISALNFDKTLLVRGVLQGIKGQYLLFEHGVLNVRKFTAYQVTVSY